MLGVQILFLNYNKIILYYVINQIKNVNKKCAIYITNKGKKLQLTCAKLYFKIMCFKIY